MQSKTFEERLDDLQDFYAKGEEYWALKRKPNKSEEDKARIKELAQYCERKLAAQRLVEQERGD